MAEVLTYEEFKEHMEMHACRHCESLNGCQACYEAYKQWVLKGTI
jgi:hypothetical protein